MNHQKIYDDLIIVAKSKMRKKLKKVDANYVYYESHHILPRCLGGTDENSNLVLLTAKEHYIVHELLTKIHPTDRKLSTALVRMSGNKKYTVSSREYEYARLHYQKTPMSDETKEKLRNAIKGVKHTEERNRHKSIVQTGSTHKNYSKEGKLNCSNAQKKLYENGYISNFKNCIGKSPWNIGKNQSWICNEHETKLILKSNLEKYLSKGYKKGRTWEVKYKKQQIRTWVCNEVESKHVLINELELYLNKGYKKGRTLETNPIKQWICNEKEMKFILIKDLDMYFSKGYKKGRKW